MTMRTPGRLPGRTASVACALAALLATGGFPNRVDAQLIAWYGEHTVTEGERVRVRVYERVPPIASHSGIPSQRVLGTVTAISADSLYLDLAIPEAGHPMAIPRILIGGVESSLGVSRAASAWDMGSTLAFLGALLFSSDLVDRGERFDSNWAAAATGAGVGMLVGGLAGALFPHERWRPAWLPE